MQLRHALAAALALSFGLAAPAAAAPRAAPATPVKKATFGLQPATDGRPDGRPTLAFGVTAGATATDNVAIVNASTRTYTFAVYATDAVNDDNGDLTLRSVDEKPTDAGAWITVGGPARSGKVTVRPRSFVVVPITLTVPADATPGDHVAGVVADLTTVSKRRGVNVDLHQRVGLRTYVRVGGTVTPGLAIENLATHYRNNWNPVGGGGVTVTYRVRNTGNVVLGADQKVVVKGLLGAAKTAHPARLPLLLPGGSVDVTVPFTGVRPQFHMTAKVQLTPVVPAGNVDTGVASTYSASTGFWAVPWVLLGVLAGVAAGLVSFLRWRRARRSSVGRHSTPKDGKSAQRAAPNVKHEVGA